MIEGLQPMEGIWHIEQKGPVTLIHGDNMDLLRYMRREMMFQHFHFAIVDPPYGISVGDMKLGATAKSKERTFKMGEWDNEIPDAEYWFLLRYVAREILIWGGNYFTATNAVTYEVEKPDGSFVYTSDAKDIIKMIEGEGIQGIKSSTIPAGRCFYAWDKKNNGMSFADCELCLTTLDKSARIIPKSRSLGDDDGDKRHPTHKPGYLYDYLHLENDMRGKKVLDTHGGSFSHAIPAFKNDVKLTIIDKEKSYFDDGLKALIDNTKTGQRLF